MATKTRTKRKAATSKTASASEAKDPDWRIISVSRIGAPPLRFKGKLVCSHSSRAQGGSATISLFRRKAGGYVASVEVDPIRVAASLSAVELAPWLEDICDRGLTTQTEVSVDHLLLHVAVQAERHVRLRRLAGEALDAWDDLASVDDA